MYAVDREGKRKLFKEGVDVWTWDNSKGLLHGRIIGVDESLPGVNVEWMDGEVEYGLPPESLSVG